jgi:RimJ/RimL family protein N-acetyltransferase
VCRLRSSQSSGGRRGEIVGYSGAAWLEFEGARRLEFGYRLVPSGRGQRFATEAGIAVLAVAADSFRGQLLAMIDAPQHVASKGVIGKLSFKFWKIAEIDEYPVELYRRTFG